ncbi:MAG: type II toxin-antitoxin system HicB family antitoxin [Methanosarcinales archaeon]|nr:MAG: type II toxin-antitoxin system HicB family antitoxin [Methanosarcinales archaeon]
MKFDVVIRMERRAVYPSLPSCISPGKTVAEALENIKEVIEINLGP